MPQSSLLEMEYYWVYDGNGWIAKIKEIQRYGDYEELFETKT